MRLGSQTDTPGTHKHAQSIKNGSRIPANASQIVRIPQNSAENLPEGQDLAEEPQKLGNIGQVQGHTERCQRRENDRNNTQRRQHTLEQVEPPDSLIDTKT